MVLFHRQHDCGQRQRRDDDLPRMGGAKFAMGSEEARRHLISYCCRFLKQTGNAQGRKVEKFQSVEMVGLIRRRAVRASCRAAR